MADEANEGGVARSAVQFAGIVKPGPDSVTGRPGRRLELLLAWFPRVNTSLFSIRISPFAVGLRPSLARRRAGTMARTAVGGEPAPAVGLVSAGSSQSAGSIYGPNYTSLHESILPCLPFRIYSFRAGSWVISHGCWRRASRVEPEASSGAAERRRGWGSGAPTEGRAPHQCAPRATWSARRTSE